MKRKYLIIAAMMLSAAMFAQVDDNTVLMTIAGEPATVGEFLYIYQKNNQEASVEHKSVDEYVDLFINFKLKVAAAKDAGIDTTAAFKKELDGYRRQTAPKYMTDEAVTEEVVQKAYGRMLTDRRVSHIAIKCQEGSSDSAYAAALEKIQTARERVTTGLTEVKGKGKNAKTIHKPVEDFNAVALEVSDDPSVKDNNGRIGYVRPFRFVYSFEEAAYNTPVGEVSEIFQTPFGLHILKVEEEIPHLEIQASHIMKMTPRGNDSIEAIAKIQIDSLYELVKQGTNFAQLATTSSDDRGSAMRGGDLGFVSRGMMVTEFENTLFGLQDNEISEPFKTQYGWHIINRGMSRGTADLANIREDVMKNINRSEYRQLINKGFVDKLRRDYGAIVNDEALNELNNSWIEADGNDSIFKIYTAGMNDVLCTIDGKDYTQQEFIEYIGQNPFAVSGRRSEYIREKYDMFEEKILRALEDGNLENKYPDFKNLMREYHDGIMLFEVSLREVWDRATQDTVGLTNYFKQHKKEYTWDSPRYKGYVIYAKDKKTAKAAKKIIQNANPDSVMSYINARINNDSVKLVRIERGIWKEGENQVVDKLGFKNKKVNHTASEEFPVEIVVGKKLKSPQEYTDERGKVINDYQDELEKQWIKNLHAQYEVVVDPEVLEAIKNEQAK